MDKDSKIINNIINFTKTNKLDWSYSYNITSKFYIFSANHKITDNKYLNIDLHIHNERKEFNSIIIYYYNNKTKIRQEILEIYPSNRLSYFGYTKLSKLLVSLKKSCNNSINNKFKKYPLSKKPPKLKSNSFSFDLGNITF